MDVKRTERCIRETVESEGKTKVRSKGGQTEITKKGE